MKTLFVLFLLLFPVFALEVVPTESFNLPVGTPLRITIHVSESTLVEVKTDEPQLFSWTERRLYTSTRGTELIFTPAEAKEYQFTIEGAGRRENILVTAVASQDAKVLMSRYEELSNLLLELETKRVSHQRINTADIYRTLSDAEKHLYLASAAYNSSRYETAELEMNEAEHYLTEASELLSRVEERPKESRFAIDLAVLVVALGVAIVLAAKYFLL